MAEVQPFRAWRYDVAQVGSLSDVTAPPYDVISPAQQKELYDLHPCNVVRLILNREEPGDTGPDEKYRRAASFLRHWQSEGILVQERDDSLYVYHQEFDWEGRHYVRKGFLGRLRLEEFGTTGQAPRPAESSRAGVYPHEQTLSGPKADRLLLTKACRMNLSAIFGLYPDDGAAGQAALEAAVRGLTPLEATDHLGVVHRLWPVADPAAVNAVREALRDKPIFIADGHHRYETALNYRNGLRDEGRLTDEAHPANFVLMHFVGMGDPGLAILPTHRLVTGLPNVGVAVLEGALGSRFECETAGRGGDGAQAAWELIAADGGQDVFGFGTPDGVWIFARLTDPAVMAALVPGQSDEWRRLAVSVLHKLVLERLLPEAFPGAEPACRYVHRLDEVVGALSAGECQLACLVPPAGIEHVEAIASKFEKMPPKSTYFYPKLLSGLVFHSLE